MNNIGSFIKLVCEGEKTEPNYFNAWLRSEGFKLDNPAYKSKDNSPIGVAKESKKQYLEALKYKIPHDKIHVWAVFDMDGHVGIPEAFDMLKDLPIGIAFSNICFEFWVLLHFERTSRQFKNCDEIISYIRKNHDKDYAKANDHFLRLKDKLPSAIENSKWLTEKHWEYDERPLWERNPYSDVHLIFEKLGIIKM
jgi:RloB-like protein